MELETTQTPNVFTHFFQARKLMKNTSRGKNPDWYLPAVELEHQLHLIQGANSLETYLFNLSTKTWESGVPGLSLEATEDELRDYVQTLRSEHLPKNARSLGIVLHLNQDASVFEFPLPEEESLGGQLMKDLIRTDPALVLQDRSMADQNLSFRILPTPASPHFEQFGCAVATSNQWSTLFETFRTIGNELNFPIRTHGLSSPLVLLSRLPRTFGAEEKPFCVMLRFDNFSFFGFYRQDGELIILRSLKHANQELPANLESILRTTAAAVEIPDLDLRVFDCRSMQGAPLEENLQQLLYDFQFQVDPNAAEGLDLPIELRVFAIDDSDEALAFGETVTFGEHLEERLYQQDFLSESSEQIQEMPTAVDMKLMRVGQMVTRIGLAAAVVVLAYAGWNSFTKMASPAWRHKKISESETARLGKELRQVQTLESLLADRSKGWETMELYSRLFPLDGSVQFLEAEHSVSPEISGKKLGQKIAYVRRWVVTGLAKNEAASHLGKLNSPEGVAEVFEEVKNATGSPSFDLSKKTRSILPQLDLSENPDYSPEEAQEKEQLFPYKFQFEVTQRIEANDELAIPLQKVIQ